MSPSDAGGRAARSALLELLDRLRAIARDYRREAALWPENERAQQVARMLRSHADALDAQVDAAGLAAGDRPPDLVHQCSANVRHRFVSDYAVRCPLCELERLQVEHRVLQQAAGDPSLCRECLGCGSYVSARNIVEGRDPSVECESCHGTGLAAGDRPQEEHGDQITALLNRVASSVGAHIQHASTIARRLRLIAEAAEALEPQFAAGDRPSLDEADELAMYRAYYGPSDDSLRSWWEHKLAVGTRAATRGPDEQ